MTAVPTTPRRVVFCHFCGGGNDEREFMFSGEKPAFICSECVDAAAVELKAQRAAKPRRMTAADIGLED